MIVVRPWRIYNYISRVGKLLPTFSNLNFIHNSVKFFEFISIKASGFDIGSECAGYSLLN